MTQTSRTQVTKPINEHLSLMAKSKLHSINLVCKPTKLFLLNPLAYKIYYSKELLFSSFLIYLDSSVRTKFAEQGSEAWQRFGIPRLKLNIATASSVATPCRLIHTIHRDRLLQMPCRRSKSSQLLGNLFPIDGIGSPHLFGRLLLELLDHATQPAALGLAEQHDRSQNRRHIQQDGEGHDQLRDRRPPTVDPAKPEKKTGPLHTSQTQHNLAPNRKIVPTIGVDPILGGVPAMDKNVHYARRFIGHKE